MLPEVGGLEYLVIAAVALIVVGPKDLPVMLRKLGQWVARLRAMAAEFRASFDDMARQSELDELRREVEAMRRSQGDLLTSETAEVNQVFQEIGDSLEGSGVQFHPPMGGPPVEIPVPVPEPSVSPEPLPEVQAAPKPRRRRKPAGASE
jgi:sec-independent protein translocase protein TatB